MHPVHPNIQGIQTQTPLFPNWIWSLWICLAVSFSDPCSRTVWQMGTGSCLTWFIPGFLLECTSTSCAYHHPDTASLSITLTNQNGCLKQSLPGLPTVLRSCCQSCPQVFPQGPPQDNKVNKSHCEILLFTMTFVKAFHLLENCNKDKSRY